MLATKSKVKRSPGMRQSHPMRGRAVRRGLHVATASEAHDLFDYQARKQFGISGEAFLHRLDAGAYQEMADPAEIRKVQRLTMLMPFAQRPGA